MINQIQQNLKENRKFIFIVEISSDRFRRWNFSRSNSFKLVFRRNLFSLLNLASLSFLLCYQKKKKTLFIAEFEFAISRLSRQKFISNKQKSYCSVFIIKSQQIYLNEVHVESFIQIIQLSEKVVICAQSYFAIDKCYYVKWNRIELTWDIHINWMKESFELRRSVENINSFSCT